MFNFDSSFLLSKYYRNILKHLQFMKKFYEEIFLIIDNFAIDLVISIAIYFFISHSFSKYQNLLTEI